MNFIFLRVNCIRWKISFTIEIYIFVFPGNENDEIPESGSDEVDDDDEMGPDLSEIFKNDDASEETNAVEDGQGIATFTAGNVEKEVAKGKCIQRQLQIWDGLLELRIAMQKSLAKINQFSNTFEAL